MNKVKKIIYIFAGFLSLALGFIGVILPILPTTPFLLLASICFFRSSEKLDKWFKGTSLYKKNLESFVVNRAMTKQQKWRILLFAYFIMMFPLIIVDNWTVKIILLLVMAVKFYYFMFKVKTME
ncbi:MAG: YbaN family protein [Bacilli bacterium]